MTIHLGDCLEILPTLASESVHTCITSPPYFGLRDYGVEGQIGLEASPREFIDMMVRLFGEVRRVLRSDGTLWLNLGDSYAASGRCGNPATSKSTLAGSNRSQEQSMVRRSRNDVSDCQRDHRAGRSVAVAGFKPKDLMGMPWRVAFALQEDGWYLRQDIIWSKPNPMPESIRDRCTKAHEYLFLLTRSEQYYFDQDAIREPASPGTHRRMAQAIEQQIGSTRANGGDDRPMKAGGRKAVSGWDNSVGESDHRQKTGRYPPPLGQKTVDARAAAAKVNGVGWGYADGEPKPRTRKHDPAAGNKNNASFDEAMAVMPESRNKRSVWTVPTQGFKEAHFATYPEKLIEPCVLAGSPGGGVVLDPFMGAGTTAVVAQRLGRQYVGCELNPDYLAIAQRRLAGTPQGLALGEVA